MGQISFPTIRAFSETCLNAKSPAEISSSFTALLSDEGITSWFVGSFAHVSQKGRGFGFYGVYGGYPYGYGCDLYGYGYDDC